jgi:predicted TIM-barrel fold metal-dependent hydrolase
MSNYIDVHHHSFNDKYREALAKYGYDNVGGIAPPRWDAGIANDQMSKNGITTAVTSISAPGVHFGDDAEARFLARHCNEFSAELVRSNPQQFGFFAALPMPDVDGTLEEIAYSFDTLNADGVVFMSSHLDGSYLGDPRFDSVMAELDKRHAIAFIHPQVPATGIAPQVDIPVFAMDFTFDTTRAAFNLVWRGTVERYPNIRFILAHAGGTVPYLAWRFDLLWGRGGEVAERAPKGAMHYLKKFYYDTALSPTGTTLGSLLQLVDADHILFGSDFPFAPEVVTSISVGELKKSTILEPAQLNTIMRESALGLFPRFS